MLGKLFNLTGSAAGTPAGPGAAASPAAQSTAAPEVVLSLDSVQEDLHTRSLLYPDAQALFQHRHDQVFPLPSSPRVPSAPALGTAFDYDADIDLDMRDVRVLIMQDSISSQPFCLLYDTQSTPPPLLPPPAATPLPDRSSTVGGMSHYSHPSLQESARRVPTSPRKPSLGHVTRPLTIQPESPQLRQGSTFDRHPSLHGRAHSRTPSRPESDAQRAYREHADEINIFASCIFGSSELLAYRGTSTKVHILPSDVRPADISSVLHDGRGSLGRSSMRSSKLSQSFSSESPALFSPPPPASSPCSLATTISRSSDRKRVLITRLFPVTLANDEGYVTIPPRSRVSEDSNGSGSSPSLADVGDILKKKSHLKQKRTPMYAVALIVSLPQPSPPTPAHVSSATRSTFHGSGSYSEQDAFPSSYGSGRRVGWALATAALGGEPTNGLGINMPSVDPPSLASQAIPAAAAPQGVVGSTTDLEERMDPVTQHWDIIMRTLTQLQTTVTATVLSLLRAVDVKSPDPHIPPMPSGYISRTASRQQCEDGTWTGLKPAKTNAKLLSLMPNALMGIDDIAREADNARRRIAVGLRAQRVTTGQNRWGIWREEARWVSRWASSVREAVVQIQEEHGLRGSHWQSPSPTPHDPFLHLLLTAFLATHTDWLQALSPSDYRKRHLGLQSNKSSDDTLPARTVVVSRDKAAARRFIFLLSAFLPAAQGFPGAMRTHRPSMSMPWGGLSQSPPVSAVPVVKEESLRRKINRRTHGGSGRRSSHTRHQSFGGGASSRPDRRASSMSVSGASLSLAHVIPISHESRSSDASSIRSANIPFTGLDYNGRKSSAATMTTITSEATVPHFATLQRSSSSFLSAVDGSSGSSAAADDLKRTLQRGDSSSGPEPQSPLLQMQKMASGLSVAGTDLRNPTGVRWGHMLSGFLGGGRRRDSTTQRAASGAGHNRSSSMSWTPLGLRENETEPPLRPHQGQHNETATTILLPSTDSAASAIPSSSDNHGPSQTQQTPQLAQNSQPDDGTAETSSVDRGGVASAFDSPVRATTNAEDGVIDVDVSFPEYIRSYETAVSSPSSSGVFPGGLDAFEQSCRVSVDGDLPANVAGWLQNYHADFCLQAVPPQGNLLEQIKESLRHEPLPPLSSRGCHQQTMARWVDVSCAVIVDTTSLSITRLQYSRLVQPRLPPVDVATPLGSSVVWPSPSEVTQLDERFSEEPVKVADELLVRAVEQVLAQHVPGGASGVDGSQMQPRSGGGLSFDGSGGGGGGLGADAGATDAADAVGATGPDSIDSEHRTGDGDELPSRTRAASTATTTTIDGTDVSSTASPTARDLTEVPRGECKTVILSALEELVRDVAQSKDRPRQVHTEEPGLLRGAVQQWLEGVDGSV